MPINSGMDRLKARGPAKAVRATCDCGDPLFRVWVQSTPGDTEIGDKVYCKKCDMFQERKFVFDAETLQDIQDPRPVGARKPMLFKNMVDSVLNLPK